MTDPRRVRLRERIEAWLETSEKLSHGAPTFWGGRETFACFHAGGYDGGQLDAERASEGAGGLTPTGR